MTSLAILAGRPQLARHARRVPHEGRGRRRGPPSGCLAQSAQTGRATVRKPLFAHYRSLPWDQRSRWRFRYPVSSSESPATSLPLRVDPFECPQELIHKVGLGCLRRCGVRSSLQVCPRPLAELSGSVSLATHFLQSSASLQCASGLDSPVVALLGPSPVPLSLRSPPP